MVDEEIAETLRQHKLNAIVAHKLHQRRVSSYRHLTLLTEFVSLSVPILIIFSKFLTRSSGVFTIVEIAGETLGCVLLVLVTLKLVYGWSDKESRHSVMLRINRETANDIDAILTTADATNAEALQLLKRIRLNDDNDTDLLLGVRETERQEVYRDALKQINGASARCPICATELWTHRTYGGDAACSACGTRTLTAHSVS